MTRFPQRSLRAALLAVLLATTAAPVFAQASLQPLDRIAAVVNEDVILRSELDRAIANIRSQYAGREAQLPPPNVLERQVLERLVLVRLQVARAAQAGITVGEEELAQTVQAVAQQNNMTIDQLRAQLAKEGMGFEEFRANLRDEVISQKLRQSFVRSRVNVSEGEVDAAIAARPAQTQQFHLAHILVATPDGATPEQIATAQKKIEGIKSLIDSGEMAFAAAAARYSDSPNALEGGDLGWRGQDEVPPAFAAAIRGLQPGGVLGPIRGASGFQLIKLVDARQAASGSGQTVTQFSGRQILIKVDGKTDDAAARAKAETLAARIAGGADFATVARENSDDAATRSRGGDLGWFAGDAYGSALGMQIAALADNGVSAPFKTDAGWVIVQRTGSREVDAANETIREQVRQTIARRKAEDEWNRFLREMRGEAYVDVRGQAEAAKPAASGG